MKTKFKAILTGEEILKRNPNKKNLEPNVKYNYQEGIKIFGKKNVNGKEIICESIEDGGIIECVISRIKTDEEIQEELNQKEIQKLNEWLDLRRNIEHPDKAVKQARLLELLG